MTPINYKTTITERQCAALWRVVHSMNLVSAQISVSGADDLLSVEEMKDLEWRLAWISNPPHQPEEQAITLDIDRDTQLGPPTMGDHEDEERRERAYHTRGG